ncbi:MAG: response regulator [Chloroflexota bacterium]
MEKKDLILLVEDNPDDLALTLRALKKSSIRNEVVVAKDGVEALDYLFPERNSQSFKKELPRLIVLDLKLPKVSGLEVLKRLRNDDRTKRLPVVILTTSNEKQDIIDCYDSGANSYIRKPVDFSKFYKIIHEVGSYWLSLNESSPWRRVI